MFKKLFFIFLLLIFSCSPEKTPLPVVPDVDEQFINLDDAEYVLFAEFSTGFSNPSDIYYGADNFLYIADTDNNRIVMMDAGGQIQGISQPIPHPAAITQNDSLQLLIVNKTNSVFKIDMFKYNHDLATATVDTVFTQESQPTRQFTGITVHNGFEYYVTVIDAADTSTVRNSSFIYDFEANHRLKGPLPLFADGTGLFSALIPTSIISLRERYLDISSQERTPAFIFAQQGFTSLFRNNFKIQYISTDIREGSIILVPNASFIGKDIYDPDFIYIPSDITLDRSGFVFVLDSGSSIPGSSRKPAFHRFSITSGNRLQSFIGDGSNNDNVTFDNPKGIAVLPFLNTGSTIPQIVYISDSGNNRILSFVLSNQL